MKYYRKESVTCKPRLPVIFTKMKIALNQDIPKLGKKGETKDVPDGYARNFLIPQKLAEVATPEVIKRRKESLEKGETEKLATNKRFRKALEELSGKTIEIELPTNEKGEFYQKVTAKIVADKLKKSGILEDDIALDDKSINKAGGYSIPVRRGDISGSISVKLTSK